MAKVDTKKTRGVDMSSLPKRDRTDSAEFVKSEELKDIRPFTIYDGVEEQGRFGPRIAFRVAWKDNNEVVKKIWTPSATEDRRDLLVAVKQNGGVKNCRLVLLHQGGGTTYWKVIGNDEALPPEAHIAESNVSDAEIPFD